MSGLRRGVIGNLSVPDREGDEADEPEREREQEAEHAGDGNYDLKNLHEEPTPFEPSIP